MNDEQFEYQMRIIEHAYNPTVVAALRARDTAQREALARVEAELHAVHDMVTMLEEHEWADHAGKGPISKGLEYCITTMHNELHEAHERADTAQAQLAEAMGLLRDSTLYTAFPNHEVTAFLARHAQTEQQETRNAEVARESLRPENQRLEPVEPLRVPHPLEDQGAQAGDERAAFEKYLGAEKACLIRPQGGEYENPYVQSSWEAWQARAALATQPAAPAPGDKPTAYVNYDANGKPYLDWVPSKNGHRALFEAAVRGAEHE